MTNKLIRDIKEVNRRLRNRGISFDANRQYPAIPTIDNSIESHTNALRAIREGMETHERRNPRSTLDSFVRLYELEDVLGGFDPGESSITNIYNTGGSVEFATRPETDAGVILDKALNPDVGAYAYDRFRYAGQHAAGKGTTVVVVAPAATVFTIDCLTSNVFELNLAANSTIANPTSPLLGQTINVFIKQDATGGRTVTWGGNWTFFNGIPTLSTEAYATDMLSCQWDDTAGKWRCSFLTGFTAGTVGSGVPYTLANIGAGAEVYKGTVDNLGTDTAELRSIVAGAGVSVTQNANDITIGSTVRVFVQATEPVSPIVNDLWFW